MELDFDKYCIVDRSPTTVLPSYRCYSKVTNQKSIRKPNSRNDFTEVNFSHYNSASSRGFGRKKIEFSQGTLSPLSLGIIDSLCSTDEDSSIVEQNMFKSESITALINEANSNSPQEQDLPVDLDKSLSSKLAVSQFNPFRKVFELEPFAKSKSHREICKSLHFDKSEKKNHNSIPHFSPAHLQALLKSSNKHGVPFFEFSMKSTEDAVYVAKIRKSEASYSFHHRRKSSTKSNDSIVGEMHVCCHLRTEESKDYMVTEFVLYDSIHSRKTTSSEYTIISWGNCEPKKETSAKRKTRGQLEHSRENGYFGSPAEIAAIIIQVPFEKRESLKLKSGDLDHCWMGKTKEGISDILHCDERKMMHVVVPCGTHSLPKNGRRGPSPILKRWRLGGGCDCGGWDISCPLDVFSNRNVEYRNRAELFVQGGKDKIPAFTMREIENGKYAVDFHAKLSSLQAFSICIAILNAAEEEEHSIVVSEEIRSKQVSRNVSLRSVFADNDQVQNMIYAEKPYKGISSFVLNPPFSPIARV